MGGHLQQMQQSLDVLEVPAGDVQSSEEIPHHKDAALDQALQAEEERFFTEGNILGLRGTAPVPVLKEPIELGGFYQDSPGLRIQNGFFRTNILPALLSAASRTELEPVRRPYMQAGLKKRSKMNIIRQSLADDHFSSLWDVTSFVRAQANGEEGALITSGLGNLFLLEAYGWVFQVLVIWCRYDQRWRIDGWRAEESGELEAGHQLLYPLPIASEIPA